MVRRKLRVAGRERCNGEGTPLAMKINNGFLVAVVLVDIFHTNANS